MEIHIDRYIAFQRAVQYVAVQLHLYPEEKMRVARFLERLLGERKAKRGAA